MKWPDRMKWSERQTSYKDCCRCHRAPGIWRNPTDRSHFLCDDCFSDNLRQSVAEQRNVEATN